MTEEDILAHFRFTTYTSFLGGLFVEQLLICFDVDGTLITDTVFIWKTIPVLNNIIYELIPAFFVSLFITLIVSYLTSVKNNC